MLFLLWRKLQFHRVESQNMFTNKRVMMSSWSQNARAGSKGPELAERELNLKVLKLKKVASYQAFPSS